MSSSANASEKMSIRAGADGRVAYRSFCVAMDTIVTIEVLAQEDARQVRAAIARATRWFSDVERLCSRFDPESELSVMSRNVDVPFTPSPILFEALQFAVALAKETDGAFDPSVGGRLAQHGFNRNFRTGDLAPSGLCDGDDATYRDIQMDRLKGTILLKRPISLDLGAVAKGLALDLADRELAAYPDICLEAGGDIVARGVNARQEPWSIGIRDPREPDSFLDRWEVSEGAVCTSGDYERCAPSVPGHHLIDPRTGHSALALSSVTVAAPTALAADGLATAAFILGPSDGLKFLQLQGVRGLLFTSDGRVLSTPQPRTQSS